MNIVIPGELRGEGGVGEAWKGMANAISQSGTVAAKFADNIQSQYDFNDYSELNQERALEKEKTSAEYWAKQDGSTHDENGVLRDPVGDYQKLLGEIDKKYTDKAGQINNRVVDLLDKRGQIENYHYLMNGQKVHSELLYNRTIKNYQNETDAAIGMVIRSGGDFGHLDNQEKLIMSNKQYLDGTGMNLGLNAKDFAKIEMARGYEASIRGILADPLYAPAFVKTLEAVPELKQKLFSKLPVGKIDEITRLLDSTGKRSGENAAYAAIYNDPQFKGKNGGIDYKKAMAYALSPEAGAKYGLDLNQQQNVAQSLNLTYAAAEAQHKETQDKNMEGLYTLAIKDPGGALRKAKEWASLKDDSVDPKELYSFQKALESHVRSVALMSAQEKQVRLDIEDKGKSNIKVNILAGSYKSENELINAVLSAGFSKTEDFLSEAVKLYRSDRKDNFEQVNNFKNAQEDWALLISTTKDKKTKRDLKDKQSTMENTLAGWMLKNNIPKSDPRVMDQYRLIKKDMTETAVQKILNTAREFVSPSAPAVQDTFVKVPAAPAADVYPVGTKRTRINPRTGKKESQIWDGKQWK